MIRVRLSPWRDRRSAGPGAIVIGRTAARSGWLTRSETLWRTPRLDELVLHRIDQHPDGLRAERLQGAASLDGQLGSDVVQLGQENRIVVDQRETVSRATPASVAASVMDPPLTRVSNASAWAAEMIAESGRVAPGDCSPGAPTDPYVPFQAYGSSRHEFATGRHTEWIGIGGGSGYCSSNRRT